MSGRFLITGLPRSRTAWMAEVCTTSRSICHHEPIKNMQTWREVYAIWHNSGWVGVADSSMGFHLGEILDIAQPRTLIIIRDIDEVEGSLRKQGFPVLTRYCHVLQNRLYAFMGHPLVRMVRFEELNDLDSIQICLEHLMPSARLDMDRVEGLMNKNIQVDVQEIKVDVIKKSPDLNRLLGEDVIREIFNG